MRFPFRISRNPRVEAKPVEAVSYPGVHAEEKALQISTLSSWYALLMGQSGIESAYRAHSWVGRCVRYIEQAGTSAPLKVYAQGKEKPTELLAGLVADTLKYPSEHMSGRQLIERMITDLQLHGNALIAIIPAGATSVLVPLAPSRVTVTRDGDNLMGYEYQPEGTKIIRLKPSEVVHIRYASDSDPLWGVGPLQMAEQAYYEDKLMRKHNQALLKNGGVPSRLVISTEQQLTKTQVTENMERYNQSHQGATNAGAPIWMTGGLKAETLGLSAQEMDFPEAKLAIMREVCAIFGVPSSAMNDGISDESNHRSMDGAFIDHTMVPLWEMIADQLNHQMWKIERKAKFQPSSTFVRFYLNDLPEMVRRSNEGRVTDLATMAAGAVTRNEVRERWAMDPLPDGDVIFVPIGNVPLSVAVQGPQEVDDPEEAEDEDGNSRDKALSVVSATTYTSSTQPKPGPRLLSSKVTDLFVEAKAVTFERDMATVIKGILTEVEDAIVDKIMASSNAKAISNSDIEGMLFRVDEIAERLGDETKPVLAKAQAVGGKRALRSVGVRNPFDSADPRALRQLRLQEQRFAQPVSEKLWTLLRESMREGVKRGESESSIAGRVHGIMDNQRFEASRIAATETATAINGGTDLGYKQSGVVLTKRWSTAGDQEVRQAHAQAEGQEVPVDARFDVGGEKLSYPGDPMASAGNAINCRCALTPGELKQEVAVNE